MSKAKKIEHVIFSLAVLIWGGVLLYFYQHDKLTTYLSVKFHMYLLVGGLAAFVIGVFNIATINVAADCGHNHDHDDGATCGHDHGDDGGHGHDSDLNPFMAIVLIALPLFFCINKTTHQYSDEYAQALSGVDVDAQTFNFIDIPFIT